MKKNKSIAKKGKNKEKKGFFQKELFFATFVQQQIDNFLTRPEKKIDQSKSRKAISRNSKNQ